MTIQDQTLQDQLRNYIGMTGESMRGLSLRAGLNPKAVADILNRPGLTPHRSTELALSQAMGLMPSAPRKAERPITYAELIRRLRAAGEAGCDAERREADRAISRLRWLLRHSSSITENDIVSRHEVIAFFMANRPATFGLSPTSYATYKSGILKLLGRAPRPRSVKDLEGLYAEVHKALKDRKDLPFELRNRAGSFLVYLDAQGILPCEITTNTLRDYHAHRLETGCKDEVTVRKHVRSITTLLARLRDDPAFLAFGFAAPGHPYGDARDKYGVADTEIADLMAEFDARVVPWSRGELSATGQTRAEFIAMLDARDQVATVADKKARLRARSTSAATPTDKVREKHKEELKRAGFLLPDNQWSPDTLAVRRGYVVAAAKALLRHRDYLIETLDELTDPEVVASIGEVLTTANEGEYPSDYVRSVLKTLLKIAGGLVRRDEADLKEVAELARVFSVKRTGIAPRNMARLRAFTEPKIDAFLDLSATMLNEINREVAARKRRLKRTDKRRCSTAQIFDADLAQRVMMVLAHDIMLSRAPRSANALEAELGWLRWTESHAVIVVPAHKVKGREEGDPDLPIKLSPTASATLRGFVETIRPVILREDDRENAYLFPSQDRRPRERHAPYRNLLQRLCNKVHEIVGIRINPHLYRHLLGWIWLREEPAALPLVSKILGHKSLETTARYYAEIDEEFAMNHWGEYLDGRQSKHRRGAGFSGRAPRGSRA